MKTDLSASLALPTIPVVAFRLLDALSDPDTPVSTIVDIVKADPAITAKVLRAANSPYYFVGVKIESLDRAVVWVGRETIAGLALCFSLAPDLSTNSRTACHLETYWRESITQAAALEVLARNDAQETRNAAFATGLLLDISQLALLQNAPQTYIPVLETARHEMRPLHEVELDRLGVTHAELSAKMLRDWNLPDEMISAAEAHNLQHDELLEKRDHSHFQFIAAANFGAATSDFLACERAAESFERLYRLTSDLFGLSPQYLLGYVTEIQDRIRGMGNLFDINSSRLPKPHVLLARASEQLGDLLIRSQMERNVASVQCDELRQENDLLREKLREIELCSCQDSLTQLYTRDYFHARLDQRLERCGDATQTVAVLFADVDGLKEVNDEFGHMVGDEVICQVAAAIRQCLRSTDVVARYGGDEFVILLDNPSVEDLQTFADDICQRVREASVSYEDQEIAVTVSVGGVLATEFPEHPGPIFADQLLDHADKAMYRAKKEGGNDVSLDFLGKGLRRRKLNRTSLHDSCVTAS